MYTIYHVGGFCKRLRSLISILEKCLKHTDGQSSFQQHFSGQYRNQHLTETVNQADCRIDRIYHKVRFFSSLGQFFRSLVHIFRANFLLIKRLDNNPATICFLYLCSYITHTLLPLHGGFQRFCRYKIRRCQCKPRKYQENKRQ